MKIHNLTTSRSADLTQGRTGVGVAGVGRILGSDIVGSPADGDTLVYDAATDTWIFSSTGSPAIPGTLTVDGTPATISSGTDWRGFPGVRAWLTGGLTPGVGDKALLVYRHGSTHLTAGNIVGRIGTVTGTSPWAFSWAGEFTIEDVSNDLRCEDAVSILDIGGTDYAVVAAREYDGSVNLSPHVLVCADPAATMTSTSTWTRHNITTTAHTQDFTLGRVRKLSDGSYLLAIGWETGGTFFVGSAKVPDITDWSSPSIATIGSGYTEADIEEMPDGTLRANLRDSANTNLYGSDSTDLAATWSAPSLLFAGQGYPAWLVLPSGNGLTVYRDAGGTFDAYWRQTATGSADSGWGSQTLLDATGAEMTYATFLQLDANHVLCVYSVEVSGADPTDSDIYSQVFTDATIFATGDTVRVSGADTTADYLEAKLVAGENITLTKLHSGGDEQIQIAGSGRTFATPSGGYGTAAAGVASTGLRSDAVFPKPTEADLNLADNTTADVSTTKHGFAPKAPNDATKYLDGTGAYSVPAGSGGLAFTVIGQETRTSDGVTVAWTLDNDFEENSVSARNLTTGGVLTVTETLPNTATISAAGTAGDIIAFAYAASAI